MSDRHQGQTGIRHLVHLRYLECVLDGGCKLPFSHPLNLETLNLHVEALREDITIRMPCEIFKMVKLRHLYSKDGIFTFHHSFEETGGKDFDRSSMLDNLQTFHRICACEACQSFLVRTPNLRKLGLHVWKTSELEGFPQLKYLRFRSLDIEEWNASEDQFLKLEVLLLEECRNLKCIPIDFANLNELQKIALLFCTSSAKETAREIKEEQRNRNGDDDDDCLNLITYNNRY
ncbi:hypothetical protein Vadar_034288 [Vaccinium darrowii]|uniref:Uncharacterized protein n=1 Tax=Vaccinium darrowii TaxID=229202 RepID=A0ACB7ZPE9_9ERIC|nr:hypothetical protein Vadar_034288 [Vaccinium darrowii]